MSILSLYLPQGRGKPYARSLHHHRRDMRTLILIAGVLILFAAPTVRAAEPIPLRKLGLGSLKPISSAEASKVRGAASGASATGLTTGSLFLYDPMTGSRFGWESTQFGRSADTSAMSQRSSAQVMNVILSGGPFSVQFPSGLTANVSAFNVYGGSIGQAGSGPLFIPGH